MSLPPVAKNPKNNGGIVHGTSITTGGQIPNSIKKYPTAMQTHGATINGIPKSGFNTDGIPKVTI